MSSKQKNVPPPSEAAKHPAAPRSLSEIYRDKRPPVAQRKSSVGKDWLIAIAILLAAIGVLAAWGPVQARFKGRAATAATSAPPASLTAKKPAPATPPKPPAPPPPAPPAGPRVQFASTTYDFGKANGDDLVPCAFTYTNTGVAPLELSEVTPGCGCMKVLDWTKQLAPGQSGTIHVRYDSHHYTGPFAKSISVTCNDPAYTRPMLEIKGYVFRPLEITPPYASISLTAETPSNSAAVRIISHLDEPVFLSPPVSPNPLFVAALTTNIPGKEYLLTVHTASAPSGPQFGAITIQTSATNLPPLSISANANIIPLVMSFPNHIRLPAGPLTNAYPYKLSLVNKSTNTLTISEPSVNAAGVTATMSDELAGQQYALMLTFPAGFEVKPGENIELSVKCSNPLFPLLKVPVTQAPRPTAPSAVAPAR